MLNTTLVSVSEIRTLYMIPAAKAATPKASKIGYSVAVKITGKKIPNWGKMGKLGS